MADRGDSEQEDPAIEVDFVVRSDSSRKAGGDDLQVMHYVEALEARGVDARVVPFGPGMRLRRRAVAHLVNIDRPFELLEAARLADGRPLVISPIHHAPAGVRAMRSAERGRGLRSVIDRLLPETPRELLAAAVRTWRSPSRGSLAGYAAYLVHSVLAAPALSRRLGAVLDRAAAVAVLATGEAEVLRTTTDWTADNAVLIPNGAPSLAQPFPWSARNVRFIMVGRIEPRKRQLDIVRIAAARALPLTIAGELQSPSSAFGRAFLDAVEAAPSVEFTGPKSRADTLRLIASARVLINASWVEVQSLVDLEAALLGTHVVGTPAGHSAEHLGNSVHTATSLTDLEELVDLAVRIDETGHPPTHPQYEWTWDEAARRLTHVYRAPAVAP